MNNKPCTNELLKLHPFCYTLNSFNLLVGSSLLMIQHVCKLTHIFLMN